MMLARRILFFLAWLSLGNALAQVPALPATAESGADRAGEARTIAIGDLAKRMVDESYFIQRVIQRSAAVVKTDALDQELEEIKGNIDALASKIQSRDFQTLALAGLEAIERHLIFLDEKLKQLQEDVQSISRPLSEDTGELAQRRKLWLDTRSSSAQTISPALLASIDQLNKEFQQATDEAAKPLSRLLELNHQANVERKRISAGQLTVRNQITQLGRKLWRFDSDNLFSALWNADAQSAGNVQALINGFAVQIDFMKDFDQTTMIQHRLLVVLGLLSLPLFIGLSRWASKIIGGDATLERFRTTLSRPLSAWLLFGILCQLIVDFDGPILRLRLLLAVAWLPVMRLQPRWIHQHVGRWIYSTALFLAISSLSQLISAFPLAYRLSLLFNGVLLVGALGWLLGRVSAQVVEQSRRRLWLIRGLIVAFIGLVAAAVVVNVMGGVLMAALLTEASLNSLYLMLFLFAIREFVRAYANILVISGEKKVSRRTEHASRLFEVVFTLFNLVLVLIWSAGTLSSLRVLRPLKAELTAVAELAISFGSISITVGGIVLFCVSVFLSFWIAKTIRGVLSEDVLPNMTLPRGVANSVSTMSYYFLLLLGLLVALTAAGFELSQLAIVVGALSVGIGFGLNTVVNNFVCGLILMIERPIQLGDTVELSGTTGKVREIGIRTTVLATFEGADVMVPNGMLLSDKLINWTLSNERRRIEIPIGVAYGSSPRAVQSLLQEVAENTPGVCRDPLPAVLFMGFGESSLDFSVRAWTDDFDQWLAIRSEMAIEIHRALSEAGIEIPFPQRDLHLRSLAPELEGRLAAFRGGA
jgi:potassium-dependent mechanosensitive channel